ncbi:MAG: rhodanese-like domain-containing protein [Chloroflexota bacterium]|nr:rhodanese-like domain-containing protein [Chloroflexota bacterium]
MSHQPPATPTIPTIDVREADRRRREGAGAAASAPLIVDVREPNEFAAVRLEGVALVPMSTFATRFEELPRGRPLLIMCAAGSRSAAATAHLIRNGWTDVTNVAGGITEWEKAGLPVQRGPVTPGEGDLPRG